MGSHARYLCPNLFACLAREEGQEGSHDWEEDRFWFF